MYKRHIQNLLQELLEEFRIVYLTGPRQSGKTTLVRSIASSLALRYITLDDQATRAAIETDPHGYIRSLGSERVVIDEFQYTPALIPAIKEASDKMPADQRGKFLLTGSADIFRSAKVSEALPGHMVRLELLPLSIGEQAVGEITGNKQNIIDYLMQGKFQQHDYAEITREEIADTIVAGGYPELQGRSPRFRRHWFDSYMQGRLFKDFASLYAARGDYYAKVSALTTYLSGLAGNLLKYSNVANDLQLDDRVVKNYIATLELMFILQRVPGYLRNKAKRLAITMPKIHFVDTGLACALLGIRDADALLASPHYGGLLENLIYLECRKHSAWAQQGVSVHHFRDRNQREVDLVLEQDDGQLIGIEVKASASVAAKDFHGLSVLAEFAGTRFKHGVLFYTGHQVLPFRFRERTYHALPVSVLFGCRD